MPWATSDVDEHKKGLSAEEKKKWVAIANAVLSKCKEEHPNKMDCDAMAIRIANSRT